MLGKDDPPALQLIVYVNLILAIYLFVAVIVRIVTGEWEWIVF